MTSPTWLVDEVHGTATDLFTRALPSVRTATRCVVAAPAVVLGSTQPPSTVRPDAGVEVVRRRSGGGAVWVAPGELVWFDVLVPRGDPLWVDDVGRAFWWLGEAWSEAIAALGAPAPSVHHGGLCTTPWSRLVCFGGVGSGEVLDGRGRKVVGVAQRRTREHAVFQCAALLHWDPVPLLAALDLGDDERGAAADALSGAAATVAAAADDLADAFVAALQSR